MKNSKIVRICIVLLIGYFSFSCNKETIENTSESNADITIENGESEWSKAHPFSGRYVQVDQLARPIINILLIPPGANSEEFNTTPPSEQSSLFKPIILSQLQGLSPAFSNLIDKNVLGQTAEQFADFLATDVLNVSTVEPTIFSIDKLTGRNLDDDVITTELQLIFGGENLLENPGLSDDNVDKNDVPFLEKFPYLAPPFLE